MTGKARVLSVSPDGRTAVVETERKSACEGCHKSSEGCTACSLLGPDRKISCTALNQAGAAAGDTVTLTSATGLMLLYAAAVFIMPIAAGIAAYYISSALGAGEAVRGAAAAAAFILVFAAAGIYSAVRSKKTPDVVISAVQKRASDAEDTGRGSGG